MSSFIELIAGGTKDVRRAYDIVTSTFSDENGINVATVVDFRRAEREAAHSVEALETAGRGARKHVHLPANFERQRDKNHPTEGSLCDEVSDAALLETAGPYRSSSKSENYSDALNQRITSSCPAII